MLTGLRIGNFKAFAEEQSIPIRPITLAFGANSSGKSSIIHSLLLANHALEKGDWDVHQPRLGAESVDLGGFPHYAHQHKPEGGLLLGFESDLSEIKLTDVLYGKDAEKAPFCELGKFGVSIRVGRSESSGNFAGADDTAAIQRVEVSFDGRTALEFIRKGPDSFQCDRLDTEHPLIGRIVAAMLAWARRKEREDADMQRRAFALMGIPSAGEPKPGEIAVGEEAAALKEEAPRAPDP